MRKLYSYFKLKQKHSLLDNFDKKGNADEEPAYFIIRKPSKSLVSLVNSKEYKGNDDKINDAIVKNCVLAGDMELLENDTSILHRSIRYLG